MMNESTHAKNQNQRKAKVCENFFVGKKFIKRDQNYHANYRKNITHEKPHSSFVTVSTLIFFDSKLFLVDESILSSV